MLHPNSDVSRVEQKIYNKLSTELVKTYYCIVHPICDVTTAAVYPICDVTTVVLYPICDVTTTD